MAASSSGALKALIESLGLGISAYRDEAPDKKALPYCSIVEDISRVPGKLEDGGPTTLTELAQIDVWQQWRDPTTLVLTESYTLADQVAAGLHGASLVNVGSKRAYIALVRNLRRMPIEREENLVHHVIDVDIQRQF